MLNFTDRTSAASIAHTFILFAACASLNALSVVTDVVHAETVELEEVTDDNGPSRGRLPDGRAFRTDEEGNQLVDYIAELEIEKEGLESRIFSLQDQLRGRDAAPAAKPVVASCPPPPVLECPRCAAPSCPTDKSGEVFSLREELETQRSECSAQIKTIKSSASDQLDSCQEEQRSLTSINSLLQDSVAELRKVLTDRDQSLLLTRNQVTQLRDELRLASTKLATFDASRSSNNERARLTESSKSASASSALKAGQQQLLARVQELRSQVRARDELFRGLDQQGRSLRIKPTETKTRSGFNLAKADDAVKNAASFRALAELSREVEAMSRAVADDIRLASKLAGKGK